MSELELAEEDRLEQNAAPELFGMDEKAGEVRARYTDSDGVTTTMRTGANVAAPLPAPFTPYPGGKVVKTTVVEQGEGQIGRSVTVDFITEDQRDTVVDFYRQIAPKGRIEPSVDINGKTAATLAGRSANGSLQFTLYVEQGDEFTSGQLSVANELN